MIVTIIIMRVIIIIIISIISIIIIMGSARLRPRAKLRQVLDGDEAVDHAQEAPKRAAHLRNNIIIKL